MRKSRKSKTDQDSNASVELSTNRLTPGILKIFGDHVSRGSNYKAVRVSTISTAQEVVSEALEKYGLEHCNPKDYVLCDVVGRFVYPDNTVANDVDKAKNKKKSRRGEKVEKNDSFGMDDEKPTWTTEYVRAINEGEKPLVLQSLWKPTDGRSRRFELRKRMELENSCFYVNGADTTNNLSSDTGSIDETDKSSYLSTPKKPYDVHTSNGVEMKSPTSSELSAPFTNSPVISRQCEVDFNLAPAFDPYLLLLKGFDKRDSLYHKLIDPTIIVGPYVENEKKQMDVLLYSPDIVLPHCWIYKKVKVDGNNGETNFDELQYLVFIEPAGGAEIRIDGTVITKTTLMKPGELVMFGNFYVFIFKDPTTVKDTELVLSWFNGAWNGNHRHLVKSDSEDRKYGEPQYAEIVKSEKGYVDTEDKAVQVELLVDSASMTNLEVQITDLDLIRVSDSKRHVEKSALQLSYHIADEDDLLHAIIDICEENTGKFKLTAAYFFVMAIEHSAANFSEIETRKLLLKITSGMQGIAWEKTKEIGKSNEDEDDMKPLHQLILPQLKPVFFWLSNALQMLHFLQCHLQEYLLPREDLGDIKDAVLRADEELLSVLEEVIMFTFQQTVYHLTKVLYGALPPILEVSPFSIGDDDDEQEPHPLIKQLTEIFSQVLNMARDYQVHPQIISQIIAYLFFFCNASLFNLLMEKGPVSRAFNWAKGVQIRGNLDALEDWAHINGVNKEYDEYLAKFVSAVGLLSTPKAQLMQLKWDQLRREHPALTPAQLQLILSEYQLGAKLKPNGWHPSADDAEPALRSNEVLESFATHPPLMLPRIGFIIDLNEHPDCEKFSEDLRSLLAKFSPPSSFEDYKNVDVKLSPRSSCKSPQDDDAKFYPPSSFQSSKEDDVEVYQPPSFQSSQDVVSSFQSSKDGASSFQRSKDDECMGEDVVEMVTAETASAIIERLTESERPDLLDELPQARQSDGSFSGDGIPMGKVDYDDDFDNVFAKIDPKVQEIANADVEVVEVNHVDSSMQRCNSEISVAFIEVDGVVEVDHSDNEPEKIEFETVRVQLSTQPADDNRDFEEDGDNEHVVENIVVTEENVELHYSAPEVSEVVSELEAESLISKAKDLIRENEDDVNLELLNSTPEYEDDVFVVELTRMNNVLGLGLIDGQNTPLRNNGTFIRSIVPETPASLEPRIRIGDRILAINEVDIANQNYAYAMELIKQSKDKVTFLIAPSSQDLIDQILNV